MSLKINKRGGESVSFNPQKIYNRVKRASKGLNVNSDEIFIKVITSVPTEGEVLPQKNWINLFMRLRRHTLVVTTIIHD